MEYVYVLFVCNKLIGIHSTMEKAVSSRDNILEKENFYSVEDVKIKKKKLQ